MSPRAGSDPVQESPIFIVGAPRSGTHLVRFCLGRHSRLHIAPETAYFIRGYGNRRLAPLLFRRGGGDRLAAALMEASGDPSMADLAPHRDGILAACRPARDHRDFARRFFGAMARAAGKPRWGEKTPLHGLYLGAVFRLFPEARVIFVTREARNTLASTLRSGHVHLRLPQALALYLRMERERARWRADPRVIDLRYEALTASPEAELRRLCAFLGEGFEPAMLDPGMRDSSYGGAVMDRAAGIGIAPDEPERWRQVLNAREAALIARAVGSAPILAMPGGAALTLQRAALAARIAKNRAGLFHLTSRRAALPPTTAIRAEASQ